MEYERSLAHIERISKITPIKGADNIEVATVLGWEVVIAKKDNFKVGDLVCYIEIDSVVPEIPIFEFLRNRKFRVRTVRLMKTCSQGLILPLSNLPKGNYKEGQDLTAALNISHYDVESPLNSKQKEFKPQGKFLKFLLRFRIFRKIILPFLITKPKGAWPKWIIKTDECRIQHMPRILEEYADDTFYVSEKLDGTSTTFFAKKLKVGLFNKIVYSVCSRNMWLKTPDDSVYWKMFKKYNIEKILKTDGRELVIQGETIGPGIQGNKYKLTEQQFYVFNVIDSVSNYHFNQVEMIKFCHEHRLNICPLLHNHFKLPKTMKEIVDYSIGKSVLNGVTEREGVVVRLIEDGEKVLSFKSISPKFLLTNEE